jgi:hypothetical protein
MEVPNLGSSTIWSLDNHVSVIDQIKVSVVWKCRDNVEVSFNVESESLIELTLSWFSLPFVNIDDVPLLEDLVLLNSNNNVSVLLINSTLDFYNLSFLVHN